ncbi:MAG: FAD-dependent oxidoreductase [Chloroflexi bacterium]|nr:FAD-dependent oxidoreductase [Chloroflexota bacterium]
MDVLVVGGGVGGVAAALAAARLGRRVILTEETDWLGGQFTAQGVPPDEHQWMEQFGGTRSYRELRDGARDYYRRYYPLTPEARFDPELKLGGSLVTRVSAEPRVWLAVIEAMLAPYRAAGRVICYLRHRPQTVEIDGDRVRAVTCRDLESGATRTFTAPYVLDATELGDLLPLGGIEYVTGRESQADTGEPHAVEGPAQPRSMQAITHVFAVDYLPGEDQTIPKPALYEEFRPRFRWRKRESGPGYDPHLFPEPPLASPRQPHPSPAAFSQWMFRRVLYAGQFQPGFMLSDLTLYNQMNDYPDGPIIEVPDEEAALHRYRARQKSFSLLYWLQTEAPHWQGDGAGYPGLRLRPDVLGTADGLAKHPYVRESRRIKAEFTVLEQHVSAEVSPDGPTMFPDSVGIGRYSVDIHLSTPAVPGGPPVRSRTRETGRTGGEARPRAWPFQLPLGALIPVRVDNLLPAGKNVGTTHITNGCYRLHPIEWNAGEAAGALAAFCLDRGLVPRQVRNTPEHLADFQWLLQRQGVEIAWPQLDPGGSYNQWANRQRHWSWGAVEDEWPSRRWPTDMPAQRATQ